MGLAIDTFQNILRENKCSLTSVRVSVYKLLVGKEPMSMHELVAAAQDIDRASIYRTVDLFERLGIIQRINIGWKYKLELTDRFSDHHHHLSCTKCSKTVAMNEDELEVFIDQIARAHGFQPSAHQIEVQGLCNTCQTVTDS